MMRTHLNSDLFGRNIRRTLKVEEEKNNDTTINIFDNEEIKNTARCIDYYIREFDFEVHLDNLQGNEIPTSAVFIKGDTNTSILNAHVFKSNIPVNLSDVTVTVNVKEVRGKTTIPADVIDVNIVQINLPTSTVDEVGTNSFELVFQSGEKVIISPTYSYKVLGSLGEGSIGTNIEKTTLQTLIEQVQVSKNTVDNLLQGTRVEVDDIIQGTRVEVDDIIQGTRVELDNIVNELEVTQTDIDDILSMIGDL